MNKKIFNRSICEDKDKRRVRFQVKSFPTPEQSSNLFPGSESEKKEIRFASWSAPISLISLDDF